jgi:copper transport protein
MTRLAVAVVALLAVGIALPSSAAGHARLVRTDPADATVVVRAPAVVRVEFDDAVRPGSNVAAIENGGGSVSAGKPRITSGGKVLEIPLRSPLPDGDYTVRWDVETDDGHELSGVIAFGVGLGRPPPAPALSAGTGLEPRDLVSRWLLFAGLLTAAGSVVFRLLVWRRALAAAAPAAEVRTKAEHEEQRTSSALLFAGLLVAFLGASAASHGGTETRYELVNSVAALEAAVGAALAGVAYGAAMPVLWIPAAVLALALVPMPTLAGHALDENQSVLAPVADVVHVGSAAVWLGALLALALVTPRAARALATRERGELYGQIAGRTTGLVVVSVALLSGTGVLRALGELSELDQLWTTGYGRTIVVKTALLGALLAVGWQNRYRLVPSLARATGGASAVDAAPLFARLRRNVLFELGGFVLLVSAVALLTDLPPGNSAGRGSAGSASPPSPSPRVAAPPPPSGALLLGGQARELAVGVAVKPAGPARVALTATVLGQDGSGVRELDVALGLDSPAATPTRACGPGCYRATLAARGAPRLVRVLVRGRGRAPATVVFPLGQRWPPAPAGAIVRRAARTFRSLRSVSADEMIESRPGNRLVSHFHYAAPDRLSYRIEGGADAVVIGSRRWDRTRRAEPWAISPQQPLSVPAPPWSRARDARLLGASVLRGRPVLVVAFLDPSGPAWFTIRVEPRTGRTLDVRMTAAAHFMRLRYSGFDAPAEIRPPTAP